MHFNSLLLTNYILYLDAFFNQIQEQKQTQETHKKYKAVGCERETLKKRTNIEHYKMHEGVE